MIMVEHCSDIFDSIAEAKKAGHKGPFYDAVPCVEEINVYDVMDLIDSRLDLGEEFHQELVRDLMEDIQSFVNAVNDYVEDHELYCCGVKIKEGEEDD